MKVFLILLFVLLPPVMYSQQVIVVTPKPGPNSAQTETMYKNADYFNSKITEALKEKDNDKAHYYINEWSHMGAIDARYYWLLADWCMAKGNAGAAKRALMRGYRKSSCYECKERADKIGTIEE